MMNPMNQYSRGWDQNYYDNNYQRNECMFGCPMNSHCEWGFCECNAGTSRLKELHQQAKKNFISCTANFTDYTTNTQHGTTTIIIL